MGFTVVFFHAHPDDESLLTAGTMARAAAEGHRVVLVVATAGEAGEAASSYRTGEAASSFRVGEAATAFPDGTAGGLGAARRRELERSAQVLGVARVEVLGYADSGSGPAAEVHPDEIGVEKRGGARFSVPISGGARFVEADAEEAAGRLASIVRDEHADVLVVYDPNGGYGHPDHLQVHRVGYRAAELAGTPVVLEATFNRDLMQLGTSMAESVGYTVPPEFSPSTFDRWFTPAAELTHAVDVSGHLGQKRASMEAHTSQATTDGEGVRSLALFLDLPDDYFALAFATEWYVDRRRPPGIAADDIFDAVGS